MFTFEMNNAVKDNDISNITKKSPVVEIFTAMVKGEDLSRFGAKADKAVDYIKELGRRASETSDPQAISELNTIRRFAIEAPILQEMKLLSVFGNYTALGWDETPEREVWTYGDLGARVQAPHGDVQFPARTKNTYNVPTFTVSAGYQVDYRQLAIGDMTKENEGMELVKIDMHNKATAAIFKKVYTAIKNATGITRVIENAGLTKASVDALLTKLRRYGRVTVTGDYALLSQFTPWAGYVGQINSNTITGISEAQMNKIAETGLLGMYNGSVLAEIQNPYNEFAMNAAGNDYATLLPQGLGFAIPSGAQSPVALFTRGGLTSFTGNDVKSGKQLTRFDLEVGCDVAKGMEHEIGVIYDTNLGGLD